MPTLKGQYSLDDSHSKASRSPVQTGHSAQSNGAGFASSSSSSQLYHHFQSRSSPARYIPIAEKTQRAQAIFKSHLLFAAFRSAIPPKGFPLPSNGLKMQSVRTYPDSYTFNAKLR